MFRQIVTIFSPGFCQLMPVKLKKPFEYRYIYIFFYNMILTHQIRVLLLLVLLGLDDSLSMEQKYPNSHLCGRGSSRPSYFQKGDFFLMYVPLFMLIFNKKFHRDQSGHMLRNIPNIYVIEYQ